MGFSWPDDCACDRYLRRPPVDLGIHLRSAKNDELPCASEDPAESAPLRFCVRNVREIRLASGMPAGFAGTEQITACRPAEAGVEQHIPAGLSVELPCFGRASLPPWPRRPREAEAFQARLCAAALAHPCLTHSCWSSRQRKRPKQSMPQGLRYENYYSSSIPVIRKAGFPAFQICPVITSVWRSTCSTPHSHWSPSPSADLGWSEWGAWT